MTQDYLFISQIGPVQSYIASARKVRDLIVGSYTLSALARAGINHVMTSGGKLIVPAELPDKNVHNGIPHRFIFTATLDEQQVTDFIDTIETAIRHQWNEYTEQVAQHLKRNGLPAGGWEAEYQRQVQSWLNVYTVAVEMTQDYSDTLKLANQAMASRKQSRTFSQLDDTDRPKCPITGEGTVLDLDWAKLHKQFGDSIISKYETSQGDQYESMGGMALFKRFASHARLPYLPNNLKIPDTDYISGVQETDNNEQRGRDAEHYFAVLHMDGDKMGERVQTIQNVDAHREFSRKLLTFATDHVQKIVDHYPRALLVYAGGDDVLALLPLEVVFECSQVLREKFAEVVGGTASAGIAIGHYKYPLDRMLNASRSAEKTAKKDYGRDAIAITETTSGGQMRHTGGKWGLENGESLLDLMLETQKAFTKTDQGGYGWLSGSLAYDMRDIEFALSGNDMKEARKQDFHRLLKRRTLDKSKTSDIESLGDKHIDLAEETDMGWDGLSNWLILARFLSQTMTMTNTKGETQ